MSIRSTPENTILGSVLKTELKNRFSRTLEQLNGVKMVFPSILVAPTRVF